MVCKLNNCLVLMQRLFNFERNEMKEKEMKEMYERKILFFV